MKILTLVDLITKKYCISDSASFPGHCGGFEVVSGYDGGGANGGAGNDDGDCGDGVDGSINGGNGGHVDGGLSGNSGDGRSYCGGDFSD